MIINYLITDIYTKFMELNILMRVVQIPSLTLLKGPFLDFTFCEKKRDLIDRMIGLNLYDSYFRSLVLWIDLVTGKMKI